VRRDTRTCRDSYWKALMDLDDFVAPITCLQTVYFAEGSQGRSAPAADHSEGGTIEEFEV
jgi:hypothetical protein